MKRLIFLLLVSFLAALPACAGCNGRDEPGIEEPTAESCPAKNAPVIVRTEVDPKEGKAPLTVRFNVVGEDDDFDFCEDEEIRYHFDFDGDGFEDGKPRKKGKNVDFTYEKPGDYRVTIWVTDAADQPSKKTNKFIKVGSNEPPVISYFQVQPAQGERPLTTQISWFHEDADGSIDRIELDYGDGSPVESKIRNVDVKTLPTWFEHVYTMLGTHTIKLRVYDDTGAMAERTATVTVLAKALPSNFVQTMGTSRALAIADNNGAHFGDSQGLFEYGLVADGHIGLKVLRYPLSAFSVTAATGEVAQLIGMADVGGVLGYARDVAVYDNLAVVVGDKGMNIYNFYSPGTPCINTSSTNCYPGTPTAPVAYCDPVFGNPNFFGQDFAKVAIVSPSLSGNVWAVANSQPGQEKGGIYAVKLSSAAGSAGVSYSNGCWNNTGLSSFTGFREGLDRRSNDLQVDGDYAYIALNAEGVVVADLGYALNNLGTCYDAGCFQSSQVLKWRLSEQPTWISMQHTGYAVELTQSRPVSGTLAAASFFGRNDLDPAYAGAKYGDCQEPAQSVSATGAVTATTTHALLRTGRRVYPGNRVAVAYSNGSTSGVLTNGGAGFLVTANVGEGTVIEGDFSAADPATFTTVSLYGAVSFAKLPSYPGANAVAFSGYQADKIGRNAVCLNFVNAYQTITSPVNVAFDSAPLLLAAVDGSYYKGIVAFDRSNPARPVQLTPNGQVPYLTGIETNLESHDDWLFVSWGAGSSITALDISDPYHLGEANQRKEVFGGYPFSGYSTNEMLYRVTDNNPQGVLLTASGELGVGGLFIDDYLNQASGVLSAACATGPACRDWVPGLQLRHEGSINDIKLVGNDYALVAQRRGGVLVFDVSAVTSGGDPKFIAHIRTKDDPQNLRVVDDGLGNDLLYIADGSSFYRIPLTDPAKPGTHIGYSLPNVLAAGQLPASHGYTCVDGSVGRIFGCGSVYRDYTNPSNLKEYAYAYPATPSIVSTPALYFADSMDVPSYEIVSRSYSDDTNSCIWGAGSPIPSNTRRIWTDMLAGRLFVFGESTYGVMMREIILQGGNIKLDTMSGRQVARACQWWQQNNSESIATYQNRPGVWKRLYGANTLGTIRVYDIGALETKLADPGYNLAQRWPKLGSIDIRPLGGNDTLVNRMVAVGPYLFVGTGKAGMWLIDATDGYNPKVIGSSRVSVPGTDVSAVNAMAYPEGGGTYTYLTLVSDNRQGGGIRLMRFPGLAAP